MATLKSSYWDKPARRLELVEALLKVMPAATANGSLHDPALRTLLESERKHLKSLVEGSLSGAEMRGAFKSMKRPLYPYQREGVERFLVGGPPAVGRRHGAGENRTGDHLLRHPQADRPHSPRPDHRPASLKPQWAREWQVFSDLPVHIVDGSPEDARPPTPKRKEGFLIINYEQLLRDLEIVRQLGPGSGRARRGAADQELGDQDRALGERTGAHLSPGLDRHTDGESDRRAGVGCRMG